MRSRGAISLTGGFDILALFAGALEPRYQFQTFDEGELVDLGSACREVVVELSDGCIVLRDRDLAVQPGEVDTAQVYSLVIRYKTRQGVDGD